MKGQGSQISNFPNLILYVSVTEGGDKSWSGAYRVSRAVGIKLGTQGMKCKFTVQIETLEGRKPTNRS